MNRRHDAHEDEGVRRLREQDTAPSKQQVARPEEWQALQRALGNQRLQHLVEQQREQRTRERALEESPVLIPPGMQARVSREARKQTSIGSREEIRVHEGPAAEALAQDLGARAFTQGTDIFLGAGSHDPVTLAHEFTHAEAGTAPLGSVQRLSLDDEEEEEVIVIDDDIIDPTETMDPFAGEPKDSREPIDRTDTMNPFEGEDTKDFEPIDRTETLDPFKEEGKADRGKDTGAEAEPVGLKADYRTTSDVGEKFAKNVLTPIQEAVSFLHGGVANAQEVYNNLERARAALLEIAKSYEGSEVLGEQIATSYNMLVAIKAWLGPHIGTQVSIETIQTQLEAAADAFEGVMRRLDIQATVQ